MNDFKEKVLNGLANVVLIGLPIALVLIFGEKFSLWINILAIGCLLLVSTVLATNIGDEYEGSRRVLYAFLGAGIALCLKALAYPGHTVMIIMATILVICTMDIIQRGQIIWIEFQRSARLHFLGKFMLLVTFLFIISLVVANFGSQKIWLPIAAALLIIILLFESSHYFEDMRLNLPRIESVSVATIFLVGVTSTIIQFRMVEIFWGIRIWHIAIALVVIIIAMVVSIIVSKRKKRKAELVKLRQENEAKELKLKEESRIQKELSQAQAEKARAEADRTRREAEKKVQEMRSSQRLLTAEDLSFLRNNKIKLAVELISQQGIDEKDIFQRITVSNNKKQIIWDYHVESSLHLLAYAANSEFDDQKLADIVVFVDTFRKHVYGMKTAAGKYLGEEPLNTILSEIERHASPRK